MKGDFYELSSNDGINWRGIINENLNDNTNNIR